jgi:hypothetical protein
MPDTGGCHADTGQRIYGSCWSFAMQACHDLRRQKASVEHRMAEISPFDDESQQRQQRELERLLSEAHSDVAASRAIALKAERQQRELSDQVRALFQPELPCLCVPIIHSKGAESGDMCCRCGNSRWKLTDCSLQKNLRSAGLSSCLTKSDLASSKR